MNIFVLDKNPTVAAQRQCDRHVVKMILETAQLLCTAHRVLDGEEYVDPDAKRKVKRWRLTNSYHDEMMYKVTHTNHPSAVWARESLQNYIWLYDHFDALSVEYEYRYGKKHLTWIKLQDILSVTPKNIPNKGLTPFKLAMPDECKTEDAVESYRKYYITKQHAFNMTWKNREAPDWFVFERNMQHDT